MALNDFTIRVSGTVAYTDNSNGSFEASATWRGHLGNVIATHNSADSLEHFQQLFNDKAVDVNSTFAIFPGTVTITTPVPTVPKDVNSFVMEISGVVTEDDNSKHVFVAQWVNGAVDLYPTNTNTAWALITASTTGKSFLDSVLEAVAGSTRVAIA